MFARNLTQAAVSSARRSATSAAPSGLANDHRPVESTFHLLAQRTQPQHREPQPVARASSLEHSLQVVILLTDRCPDLEREPLRAPGGTGEGVRLWVGMEWVVRAGVGGWEGGGWGGGWGWWACSEPACAPPCGPQVAPRHVRLRVVVRVEHIRRTLRRRTLAQP